MDPEDAAQVVREEWGLGLMSIRNMVHILEANGVRVFSVSDGSGNVDAFSFYRDNVPFVLMNTCKSAARARHDAAHELAHLVLHRGAEATSETAEHEADRFAASFLMPSATMVGIRNDFHVYELVKLKSRWNVSVASLNYRLHSIGAIDAIQYRNNCIEISKNGWRSSEPEDRPRERSLIWEKVLAKMREKGISMDEVSKATSISQVDIRNYAFGMALMSTDEIVSRFDVEDRPAPGTGFIRLATVSGRSVDRDAVAKGI
jgi:Zn-dependent peptidase ImmA (M78 family)